MVFNLKIRIVTVMFLVLAWQVKTQPDLSSKEIIGGLPVYADLHLQHKYYYAPSSFELDRDADGKPEFSFVKMTHIPSRARGMKDWKQSSAIQFTIKQAGITNEALKEIRERLKTKSAGRTKIKLLPAPIKKMEASLIYSNLDADSTTAIRSNYNSNTKNRRGALWTTKVFTIRPDKFTSQVLWDGFKKEKGLLSVAYGIWIHGAYNEEVSYQFNGPEELEKVFEQLNAQPTDSTEVKTEALINAGAFQVAVDLELWPDLLAEISFESTLSPRYGLVDVYCYDFRENIRPDLLGKIVELEAEGVGKGPVKTEIDFSKTNPDIYAHAVKFEYAVRLDKPLRYRVIELAESGDVMEGTWLLKENWTGIIDVSSQKDFNSFYKSE
ncbi:hypothetical protein [Muriicola sp. Z0-33]|uniref:hypothetical protein n=1 Tax=Muriicola sp. Z0-33 TaxID=2816957 RepID=UPI0022379B10|nr:hypothetical protein [Muriicola sp. Z0-33]MCW5516887.1 hypothetical protein [Muriicola sp. Z0-33]